MRYDHKELGFFFELPDGWRRDEHNLNISFHGPNGAMGRTSEVIQLQIGSILPKYEDAQSREKFLAEPGATVSRTRVGNEVNAVVLRKARNSEISVVRAGVHYTISHSHDSATEAAIACLKRTARFGSSASAESSIRTWSDPKNQNVARMLHGKAPIPNPASSRRAAKPTGFFGRIRRIFEREAQVQKCETCDHEMEVLNFSGRGSVMLSTEDLTSGVGHAEQCWECNRLYCGECYPSRTPNTCACGRGRDVVRVVGGTTYRGSLRLVKVRFVS